MRRSNRWMRGWYWLRAHRTIVNSALAVAAANVAVYAGWEQSTRLRALAAGIFLLLTSAGLLTTVSTGTDGHTSDSAVRAPSRRRRPQVQASLLPKEDAPHFHGREKELRELQERHRQRHSSAASGPFMLAIHGRPGVGKTALAQQLALRLVRDYPDGQLYQNMGTGGGPRPPRDILHSLLRELDWPEKEMQGKDAAELGSVFRAKTADKRMLIVLDAARSREQVAAVLPGGSGCTVITTSRANLLAGLGQHSQRLEPVSAAEASEILLDSIGCDLVSEPDLVAEAIELCDFQPNALLSIGSRARNEGLHLTLDRLRHENRLDVLRYDGRDVAERIASEYGNLEEPEQIALLLLTIPESQTFVPWALQPLLDTGSAEAGNLIANISLAGLLEHEGRDPSGFGRYRFSSLVRLFAEQRLKDGDVVSPAEAARARDRFRRAYLAGAVRVLGHLGVTDLAAPPGPAVPDHWYPEVNGWEGRVAANVEAWVRAEFGSLVRTVQDAGTNAQPALCWQIAARLGDCFSPPARHENVRRAFDIALESVRGRSGSPQAELQVRLARSGYLTAAHDYSDAIAELNTVVTLATERNDQASRAEALRRLAYAWQEIAEYDRALSALNDGQSAATQANSRETYLIELLRAENDAILDPDYWMRQPMPNGVRRDGRDNSQFIEKIIRGRAARRRREVPACNDMLREARRYSDENLAHHRDIDHEQATMLLQFRAWGALAAGSSNGDDGRSVISLATQAVRSSDQLDRPHAQAQARCTLAHALLQAGHAQACLKQLELAEQAGQDLRPEEAQRLTVRIQRVRGEALLQSDRAAEAVTELVPAERWLAQRESWAHAEVLLLLGAARRELRQFDAAIAAHAAAAEAFRRHGDRVAADRAISELSATLRAAGVGRLSVRRMRRSI
jgi:hypothetical protein